MFSVHPFICQFSNEQWTLNTEQNRFEVNSCPCSSFCSAFILQVTHNSLPDDVINFQGCSCKGNVHCVITISKSYDVIQKKSHLLSLSLSLFFIWSDEQHSSERQNQPKWTLWSVQMNAKVFRWTRCVHLNGWTCLLSYPLNNHPQRKTLCQGCQSR